MSVLSDRPRRGGRLDRAGGFPLRCVPGSPAAVPRTLPVDPPGALRDPYGCAAGADRTAFPERPTAGAGDGERIGRGGFLRGHQQPG